MRKIIFNLLIFISVLNNLSAQEVDIKTAQIVAENFLINAINERLGTKLSSLELKLVEERREIIMDDAKGISYEEPIYYVFENQSNSGFVVTSANRMINPVLVYSLESKYDKEADAISFWMNEYLNEITHFLKIGQQDFNYINEEWNSLLNNTKSTLTPTNPIKGPLLESANWSQDEDILGNTYQSYVGIPSYTYDGETYKALIGCGPLSLGLILYFHKYPNFGTGNKTYTDPENPITNDCEVYLGETYHNIDFEDYLIDYNNMIDDFSHNQGSQNEIDAVSQLLYICGVALEADYGPCGTSTKRDIVRDAIISIFNYSEHANYIQRNIFNVSEDWNNYLKEEINNNRPIFYMADQTILGGGGHAFICDGYDGVGFFHFNWTWGNNMSNNDYWFKTSALNTTNGDYNYNHEALINIKLPLDLNEPNNSTNQSSGLIPVFSGDNANIIVSDVNIDVPDDVDYYKLYLPSGYTYEINAKLVDISSSNNAGDFVSLEGEIQYSKDYSWSSTYNNVIPTFSYNNSGEILFKVLSSIELGRGATGTYRLEINITRRMISNNEDISIESLSLSKSSVEPGEVVDADFTIVNNSSLNFPGNQVRFYISNDEVLDETDILGSPHYYAEPLAGYSDREVSIEIEIPGNTQAGNKYIIFKADATDDVDEGDYEYNNISILPITVTGDPIVGKDLAIYEAEMSGIVSAGSNTRIDFSVVNFGTTYITSSFKVNLYFSLDGELDINDLKLEEVEIDGINPSEIIRENKYVSIPNYSDDNYYILIYVDPYNQISGEIHEDNNIFPLSFQIGEIGEPKLLYPADESTSIPLNPTFVWTEIGADSYEFKIVEIINYDQTILYEKDGITNSSYTASDFTFEYGKHYWWNVRAIKDGVNGDWPIYNDFYIVNYLEAPQLYYPINNSENIVLETKFEWEEINEASSYRIQVFTDPELEDEIEDVKGLIDNTFQIELGELLESTTYYWIVTPYHDTYGYGDKSEVFRFTTGGSVPPGAPHLINPIDEAINQSLTPELTWEAGSGVVHNYIIQISNDVYFNDIVFENSNYLWTNLVVPVNTLERDSTYYWRVKAENDAGLSSYSETYSFSTENTPPGPGSIIWSNCNGYLYDAPPVFDSEGNMYATGSSNLVKFNPNTGDTIWVRFGACDEYFDYGATISPDGNSIYTISTDNFLEDWYGGISLDNHAYLVSWGLDGEINWYIGTRHRDAQKPIVDPSGNIYVACMDGYEDDNYKENSIISYNSDGIRRWRNLIHNNDYDLYPYPLVKDNQIFAYKNYDFQYVYAYAISATNGNNIWTKTVSGDYPEDIPGALSQTGFLIGTSHSDEVLHYNQANGSQIAGWPALLNDHIMCPPVVKDNVIFIGTDVDDGMAKLYAFNSNGTIKWSNDFNDDVRALVIGDNERIYAGTLEKNIYCFHEQTGELDWVVNLDRSIEALTIGPTGILYAATGGVSSQGTDSLTLFAIQTSSTGLADCEWPVVGHDLQGTGCYDHNSIQYPPTAKISGGGTLCNDGVSSIALEIELTGIKPWSIIYSDGSNSFTISDINTATYILETSTPGNYTIESVSDAKLTNIGEGSAIVTLVDLPTATLSGGGTVCEGDLVELNINLTGNAPWSIEYSNSIISKQIENISDNSFSLSVSEPGEYIISEVIDVNGCNAEIIDGTANVVINNLPEILLEDYYEGCEGETLTIEAGDNGDSYIWNTGETTQSINLFEEGEVTVTVTDENGCENNAFSQVYFNPIPLVNLGEDIEVCEGVDVELNAGIQYSTYLWSTGSDDQYITIDSSDEYIVTVSNVYNCSNSDTVIVAFKSIPPIDLVDSIKRCIGDQVLLDAGPNMTSYLWSTGEETQTIVSSETGSYSVTITNNNCSNIDSTYVVFYPNPVVELGEDINTCEGNTIILDAGTGFDSYYWNTGETEQTISVNETGSFDVEVFSENGCSNNDTINVKFNPSYEISIDTSICEGESVFAGGAEQTESGIYYDYFNSTNGCDSTIITNLTVNSLPDVFLGNDTTINKSITLDAGSGFKTYTWSTGDDQQTIVVDESFGYDQHEISVLVMDYNNCSNSDTILITIEQSTIIGNEAEKSQIKIYPNPTTGKVYLAFEDNLSENILVEILGVNGQKMISKEIHQNQNKHKLEFDLSNYSQGIYFIKIYLNDEIRTEKVILQ